MLTRFLLNFRIKHLIHTKQYHTITGVFNKCTL
jgi:hypothetical protein